MDVFWGSPWFGEPVVMSGPDGQPMLAEVRSCNGYVISGGAVAHYDGRFCPMHGGGTATIRATS